MLRARLTAACHRLGRAAKAAAVALAIAVGGAPAAMGAAAPVALGAAAPALPALPAQPALPAGAVHIDDSGQRLRLAAVPQRVISLAPSLTELVYAVGAGHTLVGTIGGSDHPAAARALPLVGDHQRLDIERVLTLRPDLVLVWLGGNSQRELAQIEAAGIALFRLEPRRLEDIPRAIERVGILLGHGAEGQRLAAAQRTTLGALRARHAHVAPLRVFYQAWEQPLMTLGGPQIVTDMIALCGGVNIFEQLPLRVPTVSVESVIAANPDVLLTAGRLGVPGLPAPGEGAAAARHARTPDAAVFRRWRAFHDLTAVRRGWLYTISGDEISRPGPRAIEGATAVCAALDEVRRERMGGR